MFFFFSQIIVAGIHKNDKFCEPIVCADDWKIKHLHEIVAFMKQWKVSQRPGLTKETFVAWIHTLSGLADLAVYLVKNTTLIMLYSASFSQTLWKADLEFTGN